LDGVVPIVRVEVVVELSVDGFEEVADGLVVHIETSIFWGFKKGDTFMQNSLDQKEDMVGSGTRLAKVEKSCPGYLEIDGLRIRGRTRRSNHDQHEPDDVQQEHMRVHVLVQLVSQRLRFERDNGEKLKAVAVRIACETSFRGDVVPMDTLEDMLLQKKRLVTGNVVRHLRGWFVENLALRIANRIYAHRCDQLYICSRNRR